MGKAYSQDLRERVIAAACTENLVRRCLEMKFPVRAKKFPVSSSRELCEKSLRAAGSRYEIGSWSPEIAKFPVKFPVSREFAWRPVRSALRRQPDSPEAGDNKPPRREKPAVGGLLQFGAGL